MSPESLDREEWRIVLSLYESALDLPQEKWQPFLESCTSSRSVIEEVLILLAESCVSLALTENTDEVASIRTGSRVGRFLILQEIGRGGMGEVYAALDTELGRQVAMKFVAPSVGGMHASGDQLVREAKTASALNHANIVTVHEIVQLDSTLAIVMELVEGQSLRARYKAPLSISEVLRIGGQLFEALAAAHAAGVVHRDIKPENIMLRSDGCSKILDFGLARWMTPQKDLAHSFNASGRAAGTWRYMSPEQVKGEPLTSATDMFSMGLVLYEALTGQHPFAADSVFETIQSTVTAVPKPPSLLNPSIPGALDRLVLAMLEKSYLARPSAFQAAEKLQDIKADASNRWNARVRRAPQALFVATNGRRVRPASIIAVVAATVLGLGALLFRASHFGQSHINNFGVAGPLEEGQPKRVFPLTGNAGVEMSPAFSPDGKEVAYSWDGNRRNFDIYVKKVAGGAPSRLTDNPDHDVHPSWSPDGRRIAFFRVSPRKSQVVVKPASGGVEQVIGEVSVPPTNWHPAEPEQDGASGPVWSPDGSYLLVSGYVAGTSSLGILKMSLNGSSEAMTHPKGQENDLNPSISPSGSFIGFTRNWGPNSSDLFVVSSKGGKPVRLTSDGRDIRGSGWQDENNIIYSAERGGHFRLWAVPSTGGDSHTVTVSGANPQWPGISPDGHWIAFVEALDDASIWRLSLAPKSLSEGEPFISSAGADHSPAFSPDGKRIAFVSDRSGTWQIWISDSDGTESRQLTDFKGSSVGTPRWSPDSRRIVFDALLGGPSAIWLIDADGNDLHRLNNSTVQEYIPSWSTDGQWIYFCSLHDGHNRLYKQRVDASETVPVTESMFLDATESSNESTLYFQHPGAGIWHMRLPSGTPLPIPDLVSTNPARYWTLVGDTLYFVRHEGSPRELDSFNVRTNQTHKLANISGELMAGTPGLAVDPRRQTLLFVQKNQLRSSIILQER